MEAFPAFLPLAGRRVILAGGGEAAEAKARLLAGSPARLDRLEAPAAFDPAAYEGALLAFVASDEADFRHLAAAAARAAHVPVNVVDHPEMSDFYTPSVVDRGQLIIAIGTDGASPMLASMLRTDIEALAPEGTGRVAELARRHRDALREALPEAHQRRAFLREMLSGPAAVAALTGDEASADEAFLAALAAGPASLGVVRFVAGRGPADLLTLRALRVLAAADVICADPAADPRVVALARRDAVRLKPRSASARKLIALARSGQKVVRVIAGPVDGDLVRALAEAEVRVDVIPVAAGT